MENLGMKVTISFRSWAVPTVLRNVTEIHYSYPSSYPGWAKISFESDIHSTGCAYNLSGIKEFETSLEIEMQRNFKNR